MPYSAGCNTCGTAIEGNVAQLSGSVIKTPPSENIKETRANYELTKSVILYPYDINLNICHNDSKNEMHFQVSSAKYMSELLLPHH
jgi:hypothetical protein